MPFPKTLIRINRRFTNPFIRRFAGWLPPFAIVEHRGRRSGKRYRTPVMVFRSTDGWVFALTYGAQVDWVENVLAAGGCRLQSRGRWHTLVAPRLLQGSEWRCLVPSILRPVLALNHVDQFLCLAEAGRPSRRAATTGERAAAPAGGQPAARG